MNYFYADPSTISGNHLILTGQEAKHAVRVLRYKNGDSLVAVDGEGGRYRGTIKNIDEARVQVAIDEKQYFPLPKPEITLALGMIKKRQRLEFAVEKSVELGVHSIILFESEHSERNKVRLDRIEGKILSALKQSQRVWLPKAIFYTSFGEIFDHFRQGSILIAHEKTDISRKITPSDRKAEKLLLLVGPEGGFSKREIDLAVKKGAKKISLGSNRLRAETAAICLLSQFI